MSNSSSQAFPSFPSSPSFSSTSSSSSSSTSSSPSSSSLPFPSPTNSSSNSSHPFGFLSEVSWITLSISDMMSHCGDTVSGSVLWFGIFMLVTALLANSALLWLLFKSRHNLSPSQLLALNISIVDILYCLRLPVQFYTMQNGASQTVHKTMRSLQVLKTFGCPLFLTLMCLERYIAATFPIAYIRLGKWKPRVILCVVSWVLIVFVMILSVFFQTVPFVLSLVVVIVLLFLVMLLCLFGIMFVLCQSRPGEGASSSDSLKKRALVNVIMVIVPSAMAYAPLVALVWYWAFIMSKGKQAFTPEECTVMYFLLACPSIGLYIGPLFYLSRIRQMTCCRKCKTQAE